MDELLSVTTATRQQGEISGPPHDRTEACIPATRPAHERGRLTAFEQWRLGCPPPAETGARGGGAADDGESLSEFNAEAPPTRADIKGVSAGLLQVAMRRCKRPEPVAVPGNTAPPAGVHKHARAAPSRRMSYVPKRTLLGVSRQGCSDALVSQRAPSSQTPAATA